MAFDPREGLHQAWCLTLLDEFSNLRQKLEPLQFLPFPNLVVAPELTSTLGQWDERTRQIRLSARLLDEGNMAIIRQVFLHEVAHQIVSELYGIKAAQPHGEAFHRACRLLGIPASPELSLDDISDYGEHRLLRRVRKLMALGESANHHEAELALTKARELALKYNIDLLQQQGDNYQIRLVGPAKARMPSYLWSICEIINDYYFCEYICRTVLNREDLTYVRVIELYGRPENLDMAEYVYYFLLEQGGREWQQYRNTHQLKNRRQRLSFLRGLYHGFADKLAQQEKRLVRDTALIWKGDPGLDAFYRRRNPWLRTRQVGSSCLQDAHQAGVEAGHRMELHKGLPSSAGMADGPRKQLL